MTDVLASFLSSHKARFEDYLASRLTDYSQDIGQTPQAQAFIDALAYSSLAGGKRIRAMLVYMAANACQADNAPTAAMTDAAAAAIELVHCYSLIHDDLPAMDDDDLRRGKPSCHVQFGEANAILAGDALQTLAFELLANEGDGKAELRIGLVRELSRASGANGMVGGQAIDLAVVNQNISYDELVNMHALKTGALIDAATHMGCLCAGGNSEQAKALRHYAQAIGLAFQVQDDILDIEGSSEQTGKPQGTDIAANKPTYPAIMGLSEAKAKAQSLCDEALEALTDFGANADPLRSLATYIIQRSV
ncbi:MAG TPA: geranyl transferase [Cellvibrionales bacterium]|nr:geranyl transferase [Cellvibrionales bacterium]